MARRLPLDDPKARLLRLKTLDQAEAYGLALRPEQTAPFTLRWRDRPEILLGETRVAYVNMDQNTLIVRKEYPEAHDGVLLRALRNAADLTDSLGKIIRAQIRSEDAYKTMAIKSKDAFIIKADFQEMAKGLLGMEMLQPRMSVAKESKNIEISWFNGNTVLEIGVKARDGGYSIQPANSWSDHTFREALFREAFAEGRAAFDARFSPDALHADIDHLLSEPKLDEVTIEDAHKRAAEKDGFDDKIGLTRNAFSIEIRKTRWSPLVHFTHNGIKISEGPKTDSLFGKVFPEFKTPKTAEAIQILELRRKAKACGIDADLAPRLTTTLIKDQIASADFGYDF